MPPGSLLLSSFTPNCNFSTNQPDLRPSQHKGEAEPDGTWSTERGTAPDQRARASPSRPPTGPSPPSARGWCAAASAAPAWIAAGGAGQHQPGARAAPALSPSPFPSPSPSRCPDSLTPTMIQGWFMNSVIVMRWVGSVFSRLRISCFTARAGRRVSRAQAAPLSPKTPSCAPPSRPQPRSTPHNLLYLPLTLPTTRGWETRTGPCGSASSCQGRWRGRGWSRRGGTHTACMGGQNQRVVLWGSPRYPLGWRGSG